MKAYTDKPKRNSYFKHNVVYCKKGDVVITYPNVLAAEAATGIYSDRIYKCCNGINICKEADFGGGGYNTWEERYTEYICTKCGKTKKIFDL